MAFERFEASRMTRLAEPAVSILKTGGFGFNQAFCMRFLSGHDYVQLYFDKDRKIIGLKPVQEGEEDAIKIRKVTGGKSATIAARPFFTYFNIKHEKTRSYKASWNEVDKLVEIRL